MHAVAVRLIIEDLEGATTIVNLGNEDVTIGRKPHNTIQLTEQNVSRSHAKLIFQDDGWLVHDLSSYNGVKVNGAPVNGPAIVREGDMIQIGDYHLTLSDDVDRATVDIERPRVAANDGALARGMGAGMGASMAGMGASASSELPSVSVEDLPPIRPPNMGPGESAAYRTDSIEGSGGQQSGKNTLLLVALAIVGLIAVVAVIGLLVNWNSGATDPIAKHDEPVGPANTDLVAEPPPVPGTEDGGGLADGELVEHVESDSGELDDEIIEDDDPVEFGELVETDGGDEPTPAPKQPKQPKPKPTQDKAPAVVKLPPAEALAEARKASLKGDNRNAYALAKDAYDQSKSSEALSVMGIAACKMGSASKAKAVYKKMTAEKDKQTLEKICKPLGVELQ